MFYIFDEENYISSLCSIFHMEHSVYRYLHSIHDMLSAMTHNNKNICDNDDTFVSIKAHIVPLLQLVADLEGILLRKTFYIVEHTCPHTQIEVIPRIFKEAFDEQPRKTKTLLCDINKKLRQVYPNYQIIDETIGSILDLETRRKYFFLIPNQWKKNNDPSKVWLVNKP
ncbi:hypothetical protein ACFDTO_26730 [Microbacteriaceae bacterium 4G12]